MISFILLQIMCKGIFELLSFDNYFFLKITKVVYVCFVIRISISG